MGGRDLGRGSGGTGWGAGSGMFDDVMYRELGHQVASLLAVNVTVKKWDGTYTAGVPEAGKVSAPNYQSATLRAYLYEITPEDVASSAGVYQMGDAVFAFERDVPFILNVSGAITERGVSADRIVFNGVEYRIIGAPQFDPQQDLSATPIRYHCRKVNVTAAPSY